MSQKKNRIVVIDDDQQMRSLLEEFFSGKGYQIYSYPSAKHAYDAFRADASRIDATDLIISDNKMPQMEGTEFIGLMKQLAPQIPVILITAFGSIDTAIEAIRMGAYDYVVKPFKLNEIQITAERALEYRRIKQSQSSLQNDINKKQSFLGIIGKSSSMQKVYEMIQRVSGANSNVLIIGGSGTGKEIIARAIHNNGARSAHPFVAINCSAIPENLLESELFGHAKGSFTGAEQRKRGLFEEAEGGTLFLDEIGDLQLSLQAKLLRVLQERRIRAVGDNKERPINVRVIAATHKDLKSAVKEGRFREDLYYRLSVIPIEVPSLEERREDIPLLAEYFLKKYANANGAVISGFSAAALQDLQGRPWPGNVRELENVVERAVVLCQGKQIDDVGGAESISDHGVEFATGASAAGVQEFFESNASDLPTLDQLEKKYLRFVLDKTGGKKSQAADILGINRRTLYRKEREYGFVSEDESEG